MVITSMASGAAARRVAAATKPDHLLKAAKWKSVKIPWPWCESGLRKVHERCVGTTIPTFNSAVKEKGDNSPVSTISPEELFALFPGSTSKNTNVLNGFVSKGRTEGDYYNHIQAICRFCFLIQDYESAMICCGVEKACPIAVETLCLYLRYKRGEKDSELLYDDGNQVFDPAGNAILCVGDWNDPHKQDQFVGAIKALHLSNGQEGECKEQCDDCLLNEEQGCRRHRLKPRLVLQGDTTTSSKFKNEMKKHKNAGANYVRKGAEAIMPADVSQLHQHLSSSGNLKDLQTLVMLLCGIDIFLRHDELGQVKYEDFLQECHTITAEGIRSLAVRVQGKCDNQYEHFSHYMKDTHFQFCAVRHLLIYVHALGINGGYMFPTEAELNNPPSDGVYTTCMTYQTFSDRMNHLFRKVLKKPVSIKLTAHSIRKTAYLFAIFGGACNKAPGVADERHSDIAILMQSARHANQKIVNAYRLGADALWLKVQEEGDTKNTVPVWKPVWFKNTHTFSSIGDSANFTKPLNDLAKDFVEITLGVPQGSPNNKNLHYIVQKAMQYSPKKTSMEELNSLLKSNLPADKFGQAEAMLAQLMNQTKISATNDVTAAAAASSQGLPADSELRSIDKVSLPHVDVQFKLLEWKEKIQKWREVVKEMEDKGYRPKDLDSKSNSLLKRARKFLKCIDSCFHGDIDAFLAHYGTIDTSKWRCTCKNM